MTQDLKGKKIAILVADGFEQAELEGPKEALEKAGAETEIVSPNDRTVTAWQLKDFGDTFDVDVPLGQAKPEDYDALLLPGGVMNPDKLRMNPDAVRFAKAFVDAGKPIGAICHGPWLLVEVGAAEGRKMTSYPSLKTDLRNAGAEWVDEVVVVDQGIVTSRKPDDIPRFSEKLIEEVAEGVHARG